LAVALSTLLASAHAQERRPDAPGLVTRDSPLQVVEPDADDQDLAHHPGRRRCSAPPTAVVSIDPQNSSAPADGGGRATSRAPRSPGLRV
jgi:hypothetical protein